MSSMQSVAVTDAFV